MIPTAVTAAGRPTKEELYARGMDLIRALAHSLGSTHDEREEFVGEGYLCLVRILHGDHAAVQDAERFGPYLRLSAKRDMLAHRGRRWGAPNPKSPYQLQVAPLWYIRGAWDEEEESHDAADYRTELPAAVASRNEELFLVRKALAGMPEDDCRLFERHYGDGVTFRELAPEFGMHPYSLPRVARRVLGGVREALGVGDSEEIHP